MLELLKLLPYLWPALKEFLVGSKDHPYFQGRKKLRSHRLVAWIAIILAIILVDITYILYTEKAQIEEQLKTATLVKPSIFNHEDYAKLKVCGSEKQEADRRRVECESQNQTLKEKNAELRLTIKDLQQQLTIANSDNRQESEREKKEQRRKLAERIKRLEGNQ